MSETNKNRGGRPRVDATPITVRVPPDLLAMLDRYILMQSLKGEALTRPEALRRITANWLTDNGFQYNRSGKN